MTFLEFLSTSAGTVFVAANRKLSQNERGQRISKNWIVLQFFLDELPIPLFAVAVGGSRPYAGIVINKLPIKENDYLVEEVLKRIGIGGAPRTVEASRKILDLAGKALAFNEMTAECGGTTLRWPRICAALSGAASPLALNAVDEAFWKNVQ
jgi:hypothetical protein